MLGSHWYHGLTKKYVAAFGAIFNDITLVKYNKDHTAELKRTKVPIVYGPREKYLVKVIEEERKVQQIFPLMSYTMTGMTYSDRRQTSQLNIHPRANNISSLADTIYSGVPYDLNFELSILSRNLDDAYQILEQILPIFQKSFIFSQITIPEIGFVRDIPVILNSISDTTTYSDSFDDIRAIEYTLSFTMQVNYYGPITTTAIIRKAFANTFFDACLSTGAIVRLNMTNGNNGTFKMADVAYQGDTLNYATAVGTILEWIANNKLMLGGVQGTFTTNTEIKATSSNAVYTLESFDLSPLKVQSIMIDPDPMTANVGDPFGYTETVLEFPETVEL